MNDELTEFLYPTASRRAVRRSVTRFPARASDIWRVGAASHPCVKRATDLKVAADWQGRHQEESNGRGSATPRACAGLRAAPLATTPPRHVAMEFPPRQRHELETAAVAGDSRSRNGASVAKLLAKMHGACRTSRGSKRRFRPGILFAIVSSLSSCDGSTTIPTSPAACSLADVGRGGTRRPRRREPKNILIGPTAGISGADAPVRRSAFDAAFCLTPLLVVSHGT